MHFRGLDLTSYPRGMILWQLFSWKFMQFYFSIIRFSWKWPSRMNNLYRKMPIFVQNRFNRFHHFNLVLVSHNCPTYFSLLPLVPINVWPIMAYVIVFSLDFSFFSIYCYHVLSSVVQSISSVSASTFISFYFLVYWNKKSKEVLY